MQRASSSPPRDTPAEERKRGFSVDWEGKGARVEWGDSDDPVPTKTIKKARPLPRRLIPASADTARTALLAAKRSHDQVFFVAVGESTGHAASGATVVCDDDLVGDYDTLCDRLLAAAHEISQMLVDHPHACVVAVEREVKNWSRLLLCLVRELGLRAGQDFGSTSRPSDAAFRRAATSFTKSVSDVGCRGALTQLADKLRYG